MNDEVKLHDMFSKLRTAYPDNIVHGANMGPTWVLSAPGGPRVCPMNLVIRNSFRRISVIAAARPS